ncbi:polysaccharide pyruvyl transferase family protein [Mesorhizobium sp. M0913]|uniref:polysaccharide pyruvyl transferase family protein n=1 Tax=Mesorhizobium sp. M0913 TaxID=2957026 RepID=UPI0033352093
MKDIRGDVPVIVGGGAVVTRGTMEILAAHWKRHRFPVAFVGVEFSSDFESYGSEVMEMFNCAKSIGLRDGRQAEGIGRWASTDAVFVHADLAFALDRPVPPPARGITAAINLMPFFQILRAHKFEPGHGLSVWYSKHAIKVFENIEKLAAAYVAYHRQIALRYQEMGFRLVHVPFTPEDDLFAKMALRGIRGIEFFRYDRSIANCEAQIAASAVLVGSRFHANVAALRCQTPLRPFCYAQKVYDLLLEAGCERKYLQGRNEIIEGTFNIDIYTERSGGFVLSEMELNKRSRSATEAIERAVGLLVS